MSDSLNQIVRIGEGATNEAIKACCAAVYESDWARLLLGESYHPGGLELTGRLGTLAGLGPGMRVLDVASGSGASAIYLSERFGCEVVGVDYSRTAVAAANEAASAAGQASQVIFKVCDAERLPFEDNSFQAIICECAFCTFPDKSTAAAEFSRLLQPGGRLGLSDITRNGALPAELEGLLAWIVCFADAQPLEGYIDYLETAGLVVDQIEKRDDVLKQTAVDVQGKLLGAEMLVKLNEVDLPGIHLHQARHLRQVRRMARSASKAISDSKLGFALIAASAPRE